VSDTRFAFEVDVVYDDVRVVVQLRRIGGVTPYDGEHSLYSRAYGGASGHMYPVPGAVQTALAGSLCARRGCRAPPDQPCDAGDQHITEVREVMACSDPMVAVQRACAHLIDNPFVLSVPMVLWLGGEGGYRYEADLDLGEFSLFEMIVGPAARLISDFVAVTYGPMGDVQVAIDEERTNARHALEPPNVTVMCSSRRLDPDADSQVSAPHDTAIDELPEEDTSLAMGVPGLPDSAMLARTGTPDDKVSMLASMAARVMASRPVEPHPRTGVGGPRLALVLGDAPGCFARELVSRGYRVLGVDHASHHAAPLALGRLYRTVRAVVDPVSLAADVGRWLRQVDWGDAPIDLVLCDMVGDSTTQQADADLNWRCAGVLRMSHRAVCIFGLRTVPHDALSCAVLATRYHDPRGVEVYGVVGAPSREVDALAHWYMETEGYRGDGGTVVYVRPISHTYRHFLRLSGQWRGRVDESDKVGVPDREHPDIALGGLDSYNSFVAIRSFIESQQVRARGVMRAVRTSCSVADLLVDLRGLAYVAHGGAESLRKKFEPRDTVFSRATLRSSLAATPAMTRIMQQRYDKLLLMCSRPKVMAQGADLGPLARYPGFGALLWWPYSKFRNELGLSVIYTDYARVLPLAAMSILADRMWCRAVGWVAFAQLEVLRRPMHAWELQALLWSLSHVGTQAEKECYLRLRLEGAVSPVAVSRRDGKVPEAEVARQVGYMWQAYRALGVENYSAPPAVERCYAEMRRLALQSSAAGTAMRQQARSALGSSAGAASRGDGGGRGGPRTNVGIGMARARLSVLRGGSARADR